MSISEYSLVSSSFIFSEVSCAPEEATANSLEEKLPFTSGIKDVPTGDTDIHSNNRDDVAALPRLIISTTHLSEQHGSAYTT